MMGVQFIEQARTGRVAETLRHGHRLRLSSFAPVPFREDDLWNDSEESDDAILLLPVYFFGPS
jgi:hypothetical protein